MQETIEIKTDNNVTTITISKKDEKLAEGIIASGPQLLVEGR